MPSASDWELLDNYGGLKKYIRASDEDDGTVQVRYEQNVDAQLDRNKALQNEDFDRRADVWHVGHIPNGIIFEWITKHGVNLWNPAHQDGVRRLLNDPEYRWLRTKEIII
jgi:hypothetical protein